MIVSNIGYLKIEDVLKLNHFSIYKTHKGTHILIAATSMSGGAIYYPRKDRLDWKTVEGKKICSIVKVFDSKINSIFDVDTTKWNNGNQIMSYKEYVSYQF